MQAHRLRGFVRRKPFPALALYGAWPGLSPSAAGPKAPWSLFFVLPFLHPLVFSSLRSLPSCGFPLLRPATNLNPPLASRHLNLFEIPGLCIMVLGVLCGAFSMELTVRQPQPAFVR